MRSYSYNDPNLSSYKVKQIDVKSISSLEPIEEQQETRCRKSHRNMVENFDLNKSKIEHFNKYSREKTSSLTSGQEEFVDEKRTNEFDDELESLLYDGLKHQKIRRDGHRANAVSTTMMDVSQKLCNYDLTEHEDEFQIVNSRMVRGNRQVDEKAEKYPIGKGIDKQPEVSRSICKRRRKDLEHSSSVGECNSLKDSKNKNSMVQDENSGVNTEVMVSNLLSHKITLQYVFFLISGYCYTAVL